MCEELSCIVFGEASYGLEAQGLDVCLSKVWVGSCTCWFGSLGLAIRVSGADPSILTGSGYVNVIEIRL